ncbi:MAG: radical SAM protein [Planctomycetota bacterium]|jgi:putative pyruvate formate lyase activating enzyme
MKQQSRRRFIGSCLAAALGIPVIRGGCKKKEETSPSQSGTRGRQNKTPSAPEGVATISPPSFEPAYLRLHRSGELKRRGEELWKQMRPCKLCQRTCGVDRLDGKAGFCQATSQLKVSSWQRHFGEEKPLVGKGGSGTVFFTHCGLRCVFCINHEISLEGKGVPISIDDLARIMLILQRWGCHNINVVTPTHYSAHIILALDIAAAKGLRLPLVYNTCGWERMDILKKLDGIVDIYLPDFKYASGDMAMKYSTCVPTDIKYAHSEVGKRYSPTEAYPELTKIALLEMHRQVGVGKPASDGLMYQGLMIRHLVMPSGVSGSKEVIGWIARNLPKDTYFNIMSQYTPMHKAHEYPEIARRITREEYREVIQAAREAGLTNIEIQGYRPF